MLGNESLAIVLVVGRSFSDHFLQLGFFFPKKVATVLSGSMIATNLSSGVDRIQLWRGMWWLVWRKEGEGGERVEQIATDDDVTDR